MSFIKTTGDAVKAHNALANLKAAASGEENVLPRILDCVENYATISEISNTLRTIWGEYRESLIV